MRTLMIAVLTVALMITALPLAGAASAAGAAPGEAASGGLPTVDQVLERYYEAVGGREALERIRTRVATGRVVDDRPYAGPVSISRFEAYGREGGQWAYVEHTSEGDLAEGFNGSLSWKLQDGEVTTSEERNRSKLAFFIDPQGPLRIREYFGDLRVTAIRTVEGLVAYAVESDRAMEHYTLYFHIESGLLIGLGYHWTPEDYREVDGVLMPHRLVAGRKGGSVTYAFDEIVTNTPVSGGRFKLPGQEHGAH